MYMYRAGKLKILVATVTHAMLHVFASDIARSCKNYYIVIDFDFQTQLLPHNNIPHGG